MKISCINGIHTDPRTNKTNDLLIDSTVYVGVEIEVEGLENYGACPFLSNYWIKKKDGSLRNYGAEFVTGMEFEGRYVPIRGDDLIVALKDWERWVDHYTLSVGDPPEVGHRTSNHIHIDVRDLDKEEIGRASCRERV